MHTERCRIVISTAIASVVLAFASVEAQTATPNSCASCHSTLTDTRLSTPAGLFLAADVHRESGLVCADCHGGEQAASDKTRAHDEARGFKGKPVGQTIIATCGRCHSDAELMRRYSPRQRADQAAEYAKSVHGKRLASGDSRVATCASCHGAHGVRRVNDAKAPVFPLNVAGTCASCHANQLAEYQKSVHYAALTKGNDLSAPTCNDCHGNHAAAPSGVESVPNVCGSCHAAFAQKFQGTVHQQIFDKGCVECHSNHSVLKPSDELLGTGAHAICATCHNGKDDKGAVAADAMRQAMDQLNARLGRATAAIARVQNAGIETGAQELALAEARTRLTLARTEVHTFDPGRVAPIIADGLKIVSGVDSAAERAVSELRYRRIGLAASLAAILILVIALALKIRQLDAGSAAHTRS